MSSRETGAPPIPRTRGISWALLVMAAAAAAPLAIIASGSTLAWRDTASLFAPLRGFVVEALRELRLPLWNPHEALGIPLFAQMIHGVLHPISLATALVAPGSGTDTLVVLYVALASLGAGVLARTFGVSLSGATVAALGYALSGYVLGMSAVLTYLAAGATAPWTIAALRRAGEGRTWAIAGVGAAVAAQHLAGDPQWTVVAVALGSALAAEAGGARGLGRGVVGVVVGTAVAGVQLAPAWTFLEQTLRSGALTEGDRTQWALSPWRLVEVVAPGFFGGRPGEALVSPVFLWLGGPTQPGLAIPFVPSVFIGAPVLALAISSVRSSRAARVLAAAALVLLWLALGFHAGAAQALRAVPVWSSFRYAEKLVGPVTLCVAVLAGIGCHRLATQPSRRASALALSAGVAAAALAAVLAYAPSVEALAPAGSPAAVSAARLALAPGLGLAGATMIALAALLTARGRSPAMRRAFAPALAVLVFAQSVAASPFALRAGVPGAREARPLADLRADGPITRIETPVDGLPFRTPIPLDDADRELAVRSRLGAAPYAVPSGIDQVNTYTGVLPRRLRVLGNTLQRDVWRAMRRYAVTHVVLKEAADESQAADAAEAVHRGTLVASWPEWGMTAWAVPHRPWSLFAERVALAASEQEALETYVSSELAGIPAVVLEGPREPVPSGAGRVLSSDRGTERVRIEAEGQAGVLVVNDAWWPGWSATIDGRPVPIWRADFLVRAVPFPAGRHALEMRYEPPEVRIGWAITLSGLGALAVAAILPAWRRRRLATTPPP